MNLSDLSAPYTQISGMSQARYCVENTLFVVMNNVRRSVAEIATMYALSWMLSPMPFLRRKMNIRIMAIASIRTTTYIHTPDSASVNGDMTSSVLYLSTRVYDHSPKYERNWAIIATVLSIWKPLSEWNSNQENMSDTVAPAMRNGNADTIAMTAATERPRRIVRNPSALSDMNRLQNMNTGKISPG